MNARLMDVERYWRLTAEQRAEVDAWLDRHHLGAHGRPTESVLILDGDERAECWVAIDPLPRLGPWTEEIEIPITAPAPWIAWTEEADR